MFCLTYFPICSSFFFLPGNNKSSLSRRAVVCDRFKFSAICCYNSVRMPNVTNRPSHQSLYFESMMPFLFIIYCLHAVQKYSVRRLNLTPKVMTSFFNEIHLTLKFFIYSFKITLVHMCLRMTWHVDLCPRGSAGSVPVNSASIKIIKVVPVPHVLQTLRSFLDGHYMLSRELS